MSATAVSRLPRRRPTAAPAPSQGPAAVVLPFPWKRDHRFRTLLDDLSEGVSRRLWREALGNIRTVRRLELIAAGVAPDVAAADADAMATGLKMMTARFVHD